MLTAHASVLHHVRVRSSAADSHAAELRVRSGLTCADLQPAGLPAAAILIVRHLAARLPRCSAGHEWESALQVRLGELARVAARPAKGIIDADAPAVLFSDHSELLACLLRDWARGEAAQRWWWLSFSANRDIVAAVTRVFSESPEIVPAAIDHLYSFTDALPIIRRLPEAIVCRACSAVATVHGLRALEPVVRSLLAGSDAPPQETPARPLDPARPALSPVSDAVPPWSQWAPELSASDQQTPAHLLVWLALLVRRAPSIARSQALAASVARYFAAEPRLVEPAQRRHRQSHNAPESLAVALPEPLPEALSEHQSALSVSNQSDDRARPIREAPEPHRSSRIPPVCHFRERIQVHEAQQEPTVAEQESAPSAIHTPVAGRAEQPPALVQQRAHAQPSIPGRLSYPPLRELQIQTEYGGAFFLINAAIQMEIYADFTAPLKPGLELPLWDFLALIVPKLVRSSVEEDRLWLLLARLAGRADTEPPGSGFTPPEGWAGETLDAWMDWFAPILRDRVHAALQARSVEEGATLLIRNHARVAVSRERLDVYYSLASHPIAIRMSGLDRDPGWVPAGGRSIYFHFE